MNFYMCPYKSIWALGQCLLVNLAHHHQAVHPRGHMSITSNLSPSGRPFNLVSPRQFLSRLETSRGTKWVPSQTGSQPGFQLVERKGLRDLWKATFCMQWSPQCKFMKWIYLSGSTHCTLNKKAECPDSFSRDQTTTGRMKWCSELFWI